MIDLSVFNELTGMDLGAMADKPTALQPNQTEASTNLWAAPDGRLNIGVWECTPGCFTADRAENAEFCFVLAGKAVMTQNDGTRRELTAGDALILPRGWKGEWEIEEHLRKIYVIYG